ncbi:vanadium-dependent haloperoxidase [Algoriphagus sp. H41]|uniref:Vanadium-dependent haloperoxidase n=1 Tax=Algoriphagus oliviformis TaxID=2811231 RepID=A0ABS3C2Q5_9BACT|nr:vanadium-dependent haloperoxidase [Algoriphagus oliviformis]MBN7811170.1 vanadium-dependent haloperoxidase [Algoriphagus oliviformis]
MKKTLTCLFLLASFLVISHPSLAQKKDSNWPRIYSEQHFHITEVMVTDVASPPVAARIYAYSNLAAYRVLQESGAEFSHGDFLAQSTIQGKMTGLSLGNIDAPEFAAIYAMFLVGEKIMPSGYLLEEKQEAWKAWGLKTKTVGKKNIEAHLAYAQAVADQVLSVARKDGYLQLTAMTRYTPKEGPGYWYPTPPAYMAAVEPEWKTMQTFFLRDLDQYDPAPMAPFDLQPGASFQRQMMEVYERGKKLSEEERLIANFWDCNPFKVEFAGHMAIGVKKISPGGHWMGITGIAAQKAELGFAETAFLHALVGMALHDAFVSCWKAKYDTHRIRPETVINQTLDETWKPILQTPPFPEYTSGHSVISSAASTLLTAYFGDGFGFVDSSEVYFGLPEREFTSFYQASDEAAISRLYGGIHFRDAIENGVVQGKKIGAFIWESIGK